MLDVFARQVRMGVDYDLPVVVHARDADGDTLEVLKQFLPKEHKVYIHAYQGVSLIFMPIGAYGCGLY